MWIRFFLSFLFFHSIDDDADPVFVIAMQLKADVHLKGLFTLCLFLYFSAVANNVCW